MALISKPSYHYDFPEISVKDATLFHDTLKRIFTFCNNDSKAIVEFLDDALISKKKYNFENILSSVEITETDRKAFIETEKEVSEKLTEEMGFESMLNQHIRETQAK